MNKPNNISQKDAKDFLDFYLAQGYCVSQMNGKLLDEIIYYHPQLALQYFELFNRRFLNVPINNT